MWNEYFNNFKKVDHLVGEKFSIFSNLVISKRDLNCFNRNELKPKTIFVVLFKENSLKCDTFKCE